MNFRPLVEDIQPHLLITSTSENDSLPVRHPLFYKDLLSGLVRDCLFTFAFFTPVMCGEWSGTTAGEKYRYRSFSRSFSPRPSQSGHRVRAEPSCEGAICPEVRHDLHGVKYACTDLSLNEGPTLPLALCTRLRLCMTSCSRSISMVRMKGASDGSTLLPGTCTTGHLFLHIHLHGFSVV